jgi:arylsulfatase A-like enzyme
MILFSRRSSLGTLSICQLGQMLVVWGVVAAAACATAEEAVRTNFVLCMADDQGWGDVSYNGLEKIKTVHLDQMAASGLRLNRFYAAHCNCSPTRASVMTGRHPNRTGVWEVGRPLRAEEMTIAQALKPLGYRTGHFGKWHLNGNGVSKILIAADDPLGPGRFGFDEWLSSANFFDVGAVLSRRGVPEPIVGDGSDYIMGEALKFIAKAAAENAPFLAVVWFGNPHKPLLPLREDILAAGRDPYYGELLAIDRSMGRLRSELRQLGIAENTLVVYCSDNGQYGGDDERDPKNGGLRGGKGLRWEGGFRVPGIIEWPARIKTPAVSDIPVVTSDIYPTLLDIAGQKVPDQILPLDGISLLRLLDGTMKERPIPIAFWRCAPPYKNELNKAKQFASLVDNRLKLYKVGADRFELYDLVADPGESKDLAAEQGEVVARMKATLEDWQESVCRSCRGEDYPKPPDTSNRDANKKSTSP